MKSKARKTARLPPSQSGLPMAHFDQGRAKLARATPGHLFLPASGLVLGSLDRSNFVWTFFGSFAKTESYASRSNRSISARGSALSVSTETQLALARYGAGTIPGRSTSSENSAGVHLNDNHRSRGSSGAIANIFPPTLKTSSSCHWTCSVVLGSDKQHWRTPSMSTHPRLRRKARQVEGATGEQRRLRRPPFANPARGERSQP
jgi:hypothetical protein